MLKKGLYMQNPRYPVVPLFPFLSLGFRVLGLGFKGLGCRVRGLGFGA